MESLQAAWQQALSKINPESKNLLARGGSIVLVDTKKAIKEWLPIAQRELPNTEWLVSMEN